MLRPLAVAGLMLWACYALGQSAVQPGAPRPEFEVASIKLNKSGDLRVMINTAGGGRFTATNIPLQRLIMNAYRVKNFQISGAPAWLNSERYDVEAKAAGNPSTDEVGRMLQTLLEDRLQLKFHRETKELPVYALVIAKGGKLHETEGDCGPRTGPQPPPEPGKLPTAPCGGFFLFPGHLSGQKVAISQLVDSLSLFTARDVLDKTNLTGKYDINLEYTPEQGQFQAPPGGAPPPGLPPLPQADPNGPSLFTALQEQLGLKLESQKGPVEILVIDRVEHLSEN